MRKILAALVGLLLSVSGVQAQPQYVYGINPLNNQYYRYDTTTNGTRSLGQIGGSTWTNANRYVAGATYKIGTSASTLVVDSKGSMWYVTPVSVLSPVSIGDSKIGTTHGWGVTSVASASNGSGGYDYLATAYDSTNKETHLMLLNLSSPYTASDLGAISLNGSTTNVFVSQICGNLDATGADQLWAIDSGNNWYKLNGASTLALSLQSSGTAVVAGMDWYTSGCTHDIMGLDTSANPPYIATVDKSTGSATDLFQSNAGDPTIMSVTK